MSVHVSLRRARLGLGAAACQGADFVTNAKSLRGYIPISFFDQIPVLSV